MSSAAVSSDGGLFRQISDVLFRHPRWLLLLLLAPPLLWLGIVYLGSLLALLLHSFYSIDEFSGFIVYEFTLSTYAELFRLSNLDVILRSLVMAIAVTIACAIMAFPISYYAARYARGKWKAALLSSRHAALVVQLSGQGLCLEADPRQGRHHQLACRADSISPGCSTRILAIPVIGGPSLSISYLGTFIVFCYVWLPYMILPTQAALERVPGNLIEASADLGAEPRQTFRTVIFPLALPGIIAGSIFTFSLTLGDYIIPQIVGTSSYFLGQAVYTLQGTAGNIPLAAAFTVVPIVIMLIYLAIAKRMGAFDAL